MRSCYLDCAGKSDLTVNGKTVLHPGLKGIVDLLIYSYDIFLLVAVLGTKELIDDISVIGKEDKSGGILIEASYGEYALLESDEIDNVVFVSCIGCTGNSQRLIKSYIVMLFLGIYYLAFNRYDIVREDPCTCFSGDIVDRNDTSLHERISFSSGTYA